MLVALATIGVAAGFVWRSQLFLVAKPGAVPLPLVAELASARPVARFDAVLPVVPIGLRRLRPDGEVTVIHYWAPWERHGLDQISRLDSLRQLSGFTPLRVAVVCFDPFPSVARYVGRHRLRVEVLLDRERALARDLPCPSLPYTYVIDRAGRIALAQAGEIDWLAPDTRTTLATLLAESPADQTPAPPIARGGNDERPGIAGAFAVHSPVTRRWVRRRLSG